MNEFLHALLGQAHC
uniref:Uncharacterized protein n=1 Tax=Anguilla anguilla TaxID=7936 RepID=A0A0E9UYF2_ANGAN